MQMVTVNGSHVKRTELKENVLHVQFDKFIYLNTNSIYKILIENSITSFISENSYG